MAEIIGDISRCSGSLAHGSPDHFNCPLPAQTCEEGKSFLEGLAGGGTGAGQAIAKSGVNMPLIREEYERLVKGLIIEIEQKKAAGVSADLIAKFAVQRRLEIIRKMRALSGTTGQVIFELRDWSKYGLGGRTYANLQRRQLSHGISTANINQALINGAIKPNPQVSKGAIQSARFLKHGGRVIFVFSVGMTAYTLMTAPEDELVKVIYQEAGGFVGGGAGAGAGVGICLVFGIATAGWGLLACGIIGGVAGGALGGYAGEKVYYSLNSVEKTVNANGTLDVGELQYTPLPSR